MPFLANSHHLARVWLANVRTSIIREMEFRGNFLLGLVRQSLWLGTFIILVEIIFYNTSSLAGWNRSEVFIILALSRLIEGVMNVLFVDNIIHISEHVQKGTFDFILVRPLPKQFAAFFGRVNLGNIGNIVAGLFLLIYAIIQTPSGITTPNIMLALFLATIGIVIYYSLLVIVASIVFYIERLESLWSFSMLFSEPLTMPFDVFPRGPRLLLTYLLPLAFVVFVPAQALTGRLQWWQVPVAVGIAAVSLLLANLAWRAGLKRYSSASS